MEPFLRQVAAAFYADGTDLQNCCFVFPNRRSGSFFKKYMLETKSPKFQKVIGILERAAKSSANIMILGESGVGKEVMADYRKMKYFVEEETAINTIDDEIEYL